MLTTNLLHLLKGAFLTLEISFLAILIGLVGGTLMGIINSKQLKIFPLSQLCTAYITIIRGTPLFVQILIIYFGLPSLIAMDLSPFTAGVLALGINSCAYVAETIRSGINTIGIGQWEAAQVLGYKKSQVLSYIILPQAFRNVLPSLTNELIALIKESSILMVVGVPELTKVSKDIVARELNPMQIYLFAAFLYFVMTTILAYCAKKWERSLQ